MKSAYRHVAFSRVLKTPPGIPAHKPFNLYGGKWTVQVARNQMILPNESEVRRPSSRTGPMDEFHFHRQPSIVNATISSERWGPMMKTLVPLLLALSFFSIGMFADEELKPNSRGWSLIEPARKLGYVEGFNAGLTASVGDKAGDIWRQQLKTPSPSSSAILWKLRQGILIGVSTPSTLSTLEQFYGDKHNAPICWENAVIISEALVSGVSASEQELETIRASDAKSYCNIDAQ